MTIRILCLHGMGTNASIFSKQTGEYCMPQELWRVATAELGHLASLRKTLPSEYEFVFMEGILPCEAAPGAAALFSGPYRCWYDTPTTVKVERAHSEVLGFVQREGPFDGVIGFSQGAAVAASILLGHELDQLPPPFGFALFICSPLPFSHSLASGIDTRTAFGAPCVTWPVRPGCPDTVPSYLMPDPRYLRGEEYFNKTTDAAECFYQMFLDTTDAVRITTRTGHVIGAKDEWRRHSEHLVKLCAEQVSTVLYHQGGHGIPEESSDELCDLIETLAIDSQ